MLDSLIALTATGEFEDYGELKLRSAEITPDGLYIDLGVQLGDGSAEQHWKICCEGFREFRLNSAFAGSIRILSEHPVLLAYNEQQTTVCGTEKARSCFICAFLIKSEIIGDTKKRLTKQYLNTKYATSVPDV